MEKIPKTIMYSLKRISTEQSKSMVTLCKKELIDTFVCACACV